jgi:signal transduction histidine kinase
MVVQALPFENFTRMDLPQALVIPYRQLTYAKVVALIDENGKSVVPPFYPDRDEAEEMGRPFVSNAELQRFSRSIPLKGALSASLGLGPVYLADNGDPGMVIASRVMSESGSPLVLAVGVSLNAICRVVDSQKKPGITAVLLDSNGNNICSNSDHVLKKNQNLKIIQSLANKSVTSYTQGKTGYFAAKAMVELPGWSVFYRINKNVVFADLFKLRRAIGLWVLLCLAIAIAGSFILSKGITGPISYFVNATAQVADGNYKNTINMRGSDEFGQLADAFNKMVVEIDTWSRELNRRVEEKTGELSQAQEQIVKTQKFAALGELGAGVAHEINNPLTGVIGNAQLLLGEVDDDESKRELVLEIVNNSRRVADVVDALLRFSQQQWGETMVPVSLKKIIIKSLDMYLERLKEKKIEIAWRSKENVEVIGVERELQIVCFALLDNAIAAVEPGGRITFDVRKIEGGAVLLSVADNGCGMSKEESLRAIDPFYTKSPEKQGAMGIGLTTVQRIVDEHEAKLSIWSKEGEGTNIKIYFAGNVKVSKA